MCTPGLQCHHRWPSQILLPPHHLLLNLWFTLKEYTFLSKVKLPLELASNFPPNTTNSSSKPWFPERCLLTDSLYETFGVQLALFRWVCPGTLLAFPPSCVLHDHMALRLWLISSLGADVIFNYSPLDCGKIPCSCWYCSGFHSLSHSYWMSKTDKWEVSLNWPARSLICIWLSNLQMNFGF